MMPIWAKPRAPPPASTNPTARPGDEAGQAPHVIAGMAGADMMMGSRTGRCATKNVAGMHGA